MSFIENIETAEIEAHAENDVRDAMEVVAQKIADAELLTPYMFLNMEYAKRERIVITVNTSYVHEMKITVYVEQKWTSDLGAPYFDSSVDVATHLMGSQGSAHLVELLEVANSAERWLTSELNNQYWADMHRKVEQG